MSDMRNLEDVLNAVSILIEHDSDLIEKREQQDKATQALVNDLIAQLKDYQQREQQIRNAIATGTAIETRKAVGEVLNHYHHQLTAGVTGNVQHINAQLEDTVTIATDKVAALATLSSDMKVTFDTNFTRLKLFSETFEDQNKRLAGDIKDTLISVRKEAREGAERYTEELSDKFAKALSWKVAGLLGAVCAGIFAITLFSVWLLVPSNAEIAERKSQYEKLAAGRIAHNVIKGSDGYYARIKPKSCFVGTDKYEYCKFR